MKLWLASYPRSGNTFLRQVLHYCFDIGSTAVYDEHAGLVEAPWLADRIGYAGRLENAQAALEGDSWIAVKTHDYPADDAPAIYVVRDGRSALISYLHYLNDHELRSIPFEDVIEGRVWPGSWSAHFAAWHPLDRPNTLLLRYENLKDDIDAVVDQIGSFLKVTPRRPFLNEFSTLKTFLPTFFRGADDRRNIEEMAAYQERFDALYLDLMVELGYYEATSLQGAEQQGG